MITFGFGPRNERQESLAKNMTFLRCFMLHGYGTHWRFFFLVIRVWHFLAMAFFFMCINLLAISGSAARFLAESGCVCVFVCVVFSSHSIPLSHIYSTQTLRKI